MDEKQNQALKGFRGKRVFVSGGAGVIGTVLTLQLHGAGAHVYVGDLKPRPSGFPREIRYRQGDLNFATAEELLGFDPHYFFHLAATFERSAESPEHWQENDRHNMLLGHHLMDILKDGPSLERVVFASSYLIYRPDLYLFDQPCECPVPLKESDPIDPRNLTGAAKLYHEAELRFLAQFEKTRWSWVAARIFRVYGRGSKDIVSRWVRMLLQGEGLEVYRPEGMFDYIFADDVAEGLARLALARAKGVYNLGTGQAHRVDHLLSLLKGHFPQARWKSMDSDIPFEGSAAHMNRFFQATGWLPPTSLAEGVRQVLAHERPGPDLSALCPLPVMITSLSKKVALAKLVAGAQRQLGLREDVVGADLNASCLGRYFVSRFWSMPPLSALSVDVLAAKCSDFGVRALIPTRDGELSYFASHRAALAAQGIAVMVSSLETVKLCLDKLAFAQQLHAWGYPVIETFANWEDVPGTRLVVKERYGAGARKMALDVNAAQARSHAQQLDHPIFQPFIEGREVSIDAYVDREQRVKGVVVRRRDLVVHGESQITVTERNPQLEALAGKLVGELGIYGHVVLQVLIDAEGQYHIIECNPRFGGASRLSVAAGLNTFTWFLLEAMGEDLADYPFLRCAGERKLVRYPEDLILDA